MKLIALIGIMSAAGITRPGGPYTAASEDEGDSLIKREFAREPTEAELAKYWPEDDADAKAAAAPAPAPAAAPAPARKR